MIRSRPVGRAPAVATGGRDRSKEVITALRRVPGPLLAALLLSVGIRGVLAAWVLLDIRIKKGEVMHTLVNHTELAIAVLTMVGTARLAWRSPTDRWLRLARAVAVALPVAWIVTHIVMFVSPGFEIGDARVLIHGGLPAMFALALGASSRQWIVTAIAVVFALVASSMWFYEPDSDLQFRFALLYLSEVIASSSLLVLAALASTNIPDVEPTPSGFKWIERALAGLATATIALAVIAPFPDHPVLSITSDTLAFGCLVTFALAALAALRGRIVVVGAIAALCAASHAFFRAVGVTFYAFFVPSSMSVQPLRAHVPKPWSQLLIAFALASVLVAIARLASTAEHRTRIMVYAGCVAGLAMIAATGQQVASGYAFWSIGNLVPIACAATAAASYLVAARGVRARAGDANLPLARVVE
jgi:hypothetical protein